MGEIELPYLFAGLMALEFVYNLARGGRHQNPRDSATSLMVAIPHFALLAVLPVAWVVAYGAVARAVPWQLPATAWWIWPLGIVVMDFASYWMHRYHHALNVTWAIHSVHHSSEEFTVTTGARSSLAEPLVNVVSGAYVILVAPALLGLPLAAAAVGWLVKSLWGLAVHTRNIDKLGPLEWILATPSHHRVHHATNAIYDGKNFGFVTIVWDRLFGTFQPELATEPPRFGTHRPPALRFHPIAVAFHELAAVASDARATRSWRDKLRIWFMPAGWRPRDVPALAAGSPAMAPPMTLARYVAGSLQVGYVAAQSFVLAATASVHNLAANLAFVAFLVLSTAVAGECFEGRTRRFRAIETLRAIGVAAMLAGSGGWFGRPLDGAGLVLLALAGANLVAAWIVP